MKIRGLNAHTIRSLITPEVAKGNASKIREHLDVVTENVYRRLHSGDYGRGDVRLEILSLLPPEDTTPGPPLSGR